MTQLPLQNPERKPGMVLAIDLGTKLGFALGEHSAVGDILARSGRADFPDCADHPGRRWLRLWAHLDGLLEAAGEISVLVMEDFVGGLRTGPDGKPITTRAPIVYGSLRSIVEAWACNQNVPIVMVHAMTLKKAATGRGNAKKPEMVAAANLRWRDQLNVQVTDDNHADALCMLGAWLDGTI